MVQQGKGGEAEPLGQIRGKLPWCTEKPSPFPQLTLDPSKNREFPPRLLFLPTPQSIPAPCRPGPRAAAVEGPPAVGSGEEDTGGGGGAVRGAVLKALVVVGGVLLLRRLRRSTTRWDHARAVADALSGEKFSREQARKDPDNFFNLRMLTCPATEMVDGSRVLYFEQAFWRSPEKPFRQRFYMVKPCPKEMKCDVEFSSYAIRDAEEYKNFCDRQKDQRPQPEEVIADIAEHLTTIHLSRCGRGKRCLYEGSTPPEGFPNNWNGASYCTSDLSIHKNGEVHIWDKGFDDEGNQVWGTKVSPYEFKPAPKSKYDDMFSPLNFSAPLSLEKKLDQAYVIDDQ